LDIDITVKINPSPRPDSKFGRWFRTNPQPSSRHDYQEKTENPEEIGDNLRARRMAGTKRKSSTISEDPESEDGATLSMMTKKRRRRRRIENPVGRQSTRTVVAVER